MCTDLLAAPDPEPLLAAIRGDSTHGATFLADLALQALELAAQSALGGPETTAAELHQALKHWARQAAEARPSMAPLVNAAAAWFSRLGASPTATAADLRTEAIALARALREELSEAGRQAATEAAALLTSSDVVVTCSYSDTVRQTLELAHQSALGGPKIVVVIDPEPTPEGGHGQRLARALESSGLRVRVSVSPQAAETASTLLLGTDAVYRNLSIVNGTPSRAVVLAAQRAGVPCYVVCTTWKLDPRPSLAVQVEPGLDVVPGEALTGIITEKGALTPSELQARFAEQSQALDLLGANDWLLS